MSDPYRPSNYHASTYNPSTYAPQDAYVSGALTTRPGSSGYDDGRGYYPSQSNMELSQSSYRRTSGGGDSNYLDPDGHRSSRHHKSSRSHSSHRDDRDRDEKGGRERSKSRGKEWGATAVGGAAGAFIGNEIGHGPLGIGAGLIAGAIGAHELERRHEKHQAKKRAEDDGYGGGRPSHHRRRSSGGLLSDVKGKVEGFLNPDGGDKRRSRSHVGSSRKSGRDYSDDESEDDERYERRSTKGGKSRRDDYY